MARVRDFLERRGAPTIFIARFVGFLRPLAPFAAGAVGMSYRPFLAFNALGAVAWGGSAVGAGYLFGQPAERMLRGGGIGLVAVLLVAALALVVGRHTFGSRTAVADDRSAQHRRASASRSSDARTSARSSGSCRTNTSVQPRGSGAQTRVLQGKFAAGATGSW